MKKILLSSDAAEGGKAAPAKQGKAPELVKVKALVPVGEDVNGTFIRATKGQVFEIAKSRLAALKGLVELVTVLMVVALLSLCSPSAQAQQFGPATTFTISTTNATATASNANTAFSMTKYDGFDLDFRIGLTNAATGTIDVRWSTSNDGVNYHTGTAIPGVSGWFSIPLTNGGAPVSWRTNITMNSAGYWHLLWVTNQSGQHYTNLVVKPYVKPKRNG